MVETIYSNPCMCALRLKYPKICEPFRLVAVMSWQVREYAVLDREKRQRVRMKRASECSGSHSLACQAFVLLLASPCTPSGQGSCKNE
jgi:hypothetical protein